MINTTMKLIIFTISIFFLITGLLIAKPIDEIIIKGNERISSETIKVFSSYNKGDDINQNDLNDIIKSLYETDFFENVTIEIVNNNLIITVKENPIIQEVVIEGIKKEKLKEDIYDSLILKNKSSYVIYLAKNDLQKIKNMLRVSGFYLSEVKTSIQNNNNNTVNLIYNIDLGEKALIKKIKFIGDKKFKDRKLRQVIVSEESKFWKFISSKKYLNTKRIQLDERLLLNFYKNNGYYSAKIETSSAKFIDDQYFELIYNINAGKKFIFNNLNISLPIDYDAKYFKEISDTLAELKNTTYTLNKIDKILKEIDKISLSYQYEFISAHVKEEIIDNHKLNLTFVISESEKSYVEKINIIGNSVTRENVIRNSLFVDEGDAFNELLHNKSLNRIRGRGIFEKVDSKILEGSNPNLKIIEIEVEEKATGEISAGAGFATSGSTFGFGIKEKNYLGQGIKVNANMTFSDNSVKGELSMNNPNFKNSNNSLSTSISSTTTDFLADYGYKSNLSSVSFGSNFERYEDLLFYPTIDINYEELETVPKASTNLKKQQGSYFETAFIYTLSYDKRNQRFQPSEGFKSQFTQSLPLVSENYELKNVYEITKYVPFDNGMIGNITFGAAAVNGVTGKDVRISKRLYVPERKLRGFKKGRLGPIENNDYVGGNYRAMFNVNTTLPNLFPESQNTDFRIFFDSATLWGVDYSSEVKDTKKIRSSAGVAIDWYTPIGPLSFSLAQPITQDSTDQTETFRFNIGTTF
jgi:outer membrane protein insertion porin family